MMLERGVPVRHTTIHRWVQRYSPESGDYLESIPEPPTTEYRVVETFVLVEKQRKYLYRAISPEGITLDFVLCDTANRQAAECLFQSRLQEAGNATVTADTVSLA
jgi:transposase-like protein